MARNEEKTFAVYVGEFIGIWFGVAIGGILVAWPVMAAWNHAIPAIFALRSIDFWQAACLAWLSMFLLKPAVTP